MSQRLVVVARVKSDERRRTDLISHGHKLAAVARREAGCVSFRLYADTECDDDFVFVEEWESEEALREHFASPEVIPLLANVVAAQAAEPEIRIHTVTDTRSTRA